MERQIEKLLETIEAAEWLYSHLIETGATRKQIEDQHFLICDLKQALRKAKDFQENNFHKVHPSVWVGNYPKPVWED